MAVALAEELAQRGTDVLFAGTREGLESRILPPLGFRLETIRVGGLKNVGTVRFLKTTLQLPGSLLQSFSILRRYRPSLIVGVGGYSSGPLIAAGRMLRIPSLILEPNVLAGFTNRLLRPIVTAAAVAFEETAAWFGPKARVTGIPVRRGFFEIPPGNFDHVPLRLLVFGGSRGSRPINRLVCEALAELPEDRVHIVHQTGPGEYDEVARAYAGRGQARVVPYIEKMAKEFKDSDLIVSRAGALTVAEIAAAGRPAILIPFPHAADDHQRRNAEAMESRGAALLMVQAECSGALLARTILSLEEDRNRLAAMAAAARRHGKPDATISILSLMEKVAA